VFGLLGAKEWPQVSDAAIDEMATELSAQLTPPGDTWVLTLEAGSAEGQPQ
jgi:hypothetical protein